MRRHLLFAVLSFAVGVAVFAWWRWLPDSQQPPVIQVRASDLIVQNQSKAAWSDVEVWVNDQYRGVTGSLASGQVLNVPLRSLVAGYNQRFEPGRQPVRGVLLTAREEGGRAVRFTWGNVRRK